MSCYVVPALLLTMIDDSMLFTNLSMSSSGQFCGCVDVCLWIEHASSWGCCKVCTLKPVQAHIDVGESLLLHGQLVALGNNKI